MEPTGKLYHTKSTCGDRCSCSTRKAASGARTLNISGMGYRPEAELTTSIMERAALTSNAVLICCGVGIAQLLLYVQQVGHWHYDIEFPRYKNLLVMQGR